MSLAIEQARLAAALDEVPVGAIVVMNDEVVGVGHNRTLVDADPTAHAEVVAIRAAAKRLANHRMPDAQLYVTLEPCLMCVGAMFHARIERVVFGAFDPKTGAGGSVVDAFSLDRLNHHATVEGGLMADECGRLLSEFFERRRRIKRALKGESA